MKISQVKITNFRGYKDETIIDFGELTAFVGRNDVGKSTVLEALNCMVDRVLWCRSSGFLGFVANLQRVFVKLWVEGQPAHAHSLGIAVRRMGWQGIGQAII